MYTVALDSGATVRAMERDVRVTNIQDIDPPRLHPEHRDRTAFLRGLARVRAAAAAEEEEEEEVPIGILVAIPRWCGLTVLTCQTQLNPPMKKISATMRDKLLF